jgi:septum formation protein
MKLILASASPRRQELLCTLGYEFTAEVADVNETLEEKLPPHETVMRLALQKAEKVYENHPEDCVVGVDTLVFLDGEALGKPQGVEQAKEMLRRLSGRRHEVLSGVAILSPKGRETFFVRTGVRFYELSHELIARYAATGEPLDKAGAYGIQSLGALLVEGIDGDYFNVVGLPVAELARRLEKLGFRPKEY